MLAHQRVLDGFRMAATVMGRDREMGRGAGPALCHCALLAFPSPLWNGSFEQDLFVQRCRMTAMGDASSPERDVSKSPRETTLRSPNFLKLPLKFLWKAYLLPFTPDGAL